MDRSTWNPRTWSFSDWIMVLLLIALLVMWLMPNPRSALNIHVYTTPSGESK